MANVIALATKIRIRSCMSTLNLNFFVGQAPPYQAEQRQPERLPYNGNAKVRVLSKQRRSVRAHTPNQFNE